MLSSSFFFFLHLLEIFSNGLDVSPTTMCISYLHHHFHHHHHLDTSNHHQNGSRSSSRSSNDSICQYDTIIVVVLFYFYFLCFFGTRRSPPSVSARLFISFFTVIFHPFCHERCSPDGHLAVSSQFFFICKRLSCTPSTSVFVSQLRCKSLHYTTLYFFTHS